MENKKFNCSSEDHLEIESSCYCMKCQVYMCKKCELFHSKLLKNHKNFISYNNENKENIFNGYCREKDHQMKLEFFCKNHNQLCCAACIAKIKKDEIGKHKDCNVCIIEDIKEEKIYKLNNNIQLLAELSSTIEESINNLKIIFEAINKRKNDLKGTIQNIFTKIRNELNNREDFLLLKVDEIFENIFFDENTIKNYNKLPNKIKLSLEKSKLINIEDYKSNDELISLIEKCINLENNIKEIDDIKKNIKKYENSNDYQTKFIPEEKEINNFIDKIKNYGKIIYFNSKPFRTSIIGNDINKQNAIINWIIEKTNKNKINLELLFKMSINGSKCEEFHRLCDNKGPTLTLVKTTENKIFGGFTPLDWKSEGGEIKDKSCQSFIFSLNLMKKFDMINNGGKAIRCLKNEGPDFGDEDFSLMKNMKKGRTFANDSCNYLSNYNLELIGKKGEYDNFETEELEVYKVIIN